MLLVFFKIIAGMGGKPQEWLLALFCSKTLAFFNFSTSRIALQEKNSSTSALLYLSWSIRVGLQIRLKPIHSGVAENKINSDADVGIVTSKYICNIGRRRYTADLNVIRTGI